MAKVHIEFQRVQTWLFSVPKLRPMVGANTLMGEVLRIELPKLARDKSRGWTLESISAGYPPREPQDPLGEHDDPAVDAGDGIVSRDGGHFEARFQSGASEFAEAAMKDLRQRLPGLRFRISIDKEELAQWTADLSLELPVLARCAWSGRGLASEQVWQGDDPAEVTVEVGKRWKAATRTERRDLVSLLIGCTKKLKNLSRPDTFEELVSGGYLAVIHADGNNVGRSAGEDEAERAKFFHRNRVLLRQALLFAIDQTCGDAGPAPLLPLMLGGDDVLVVSRADKALPFVVKLCQELEQLQSNREEEFHLTLGMGIVFAKPTIPFHRLHEVAEGLAGSAKRRFRGMQSKHASVADWAVYTSTWLDDPGIVRARDWVRGSGENKRVLSQRPMRVLGSGLASLEGLLAGSAGPSGDTPSERAPRSQLRYLLDQLPRGKALSELAFAELSKKASEALKRAGIDGAAHLWHRADSTQPYSTALLDLVEVNEIGNLGRAGASRLHGQDDGAAKSREGANA